MLGRAQLMAFIGTEKPGPARAFYAEQLGLSFVADEPHALVFDSNGTMLRISKLDKHNPPPFTVLGWKVGQIESAVDALVQAGIEIKRFEGFEQDPQGIAAFPDGTRVAWFEDPDGNMLSVSEFP